MDIIEQLTRDEGIKYKPYIDITNHTTIGTGRNLDAIGISEDERVLMLNNDIQRAEHGLANNIQWINSLDKIRYWAIVNMTFNLGLVGLLAFHNMLTKLQNGDYAGASQEMLNSKWATQVGERAKRLAQQILTGEWV